MKSIYDDAFQNAVNRHVPAILSLPDQGRARHFRTRFLGEDLQGFYLESVPAARALLEPLIDQRRQVRISFTTPAGARLECDAMLVEKQPNHRRNDDAEVDAILLWFPTQIRQVQRRSAPRIACENPRRVPLQFWRIGEKDDLAAQPIAAAELKVKAIDMSAGGAGVICETPTSHLGPNDRLRVSLTCADEFLIVEARVRNLSSSDEGLRLGVEFARMQNDAQYAKSLAKITQFISRLEIDAKNHPGASKVA